MISIHDVRLIVTDMDGTFLGPGGVLLEENCRALAEAEGRGMRIAFASGRLPAVLSGLALRAGLKRCAILGLNGAHVLEAPFGKTLSIHPLREALFDRCMGILTENGCLYNLYTDRGVYTNRPMSRERAAAFRAHFADSGCRVEVGADAMDRVEGDIPIKFMVHCQEAPKGAARARAEIARLPGIEITSARAGTYEIMAECGGKAGAVRELAAGLGIPLSAVMAFGDYDNDVEMLALCGHSVAMGNASPAALRAARRRTLCNAEAGVAHVVRRLLQENQRSLEEEKL